MSKLTETQKVYIYISCSLRILMEYMYYNCSYLNSKHFDLNSFLMFNTCLKSSGRSCSFS